MRSRFDPGTLANKRTDVKAGTTPRSTSVFSERGNERGEESPNSPLRNGKSCKEEDQTGPTITSFFGASAAGGRLLEFQEKSGIPSTNLWITNSSPPGF